MNIALITLSTPTKWNYKAASALPYHLIKNRRNDIKIEIFSFNINDVMPDSISLIESNLNCKIHIIKLPKWYTALFKYHLLTFRIFLRYPFLAYLNLSETDVKKVNSSNPDKIWIYGEELSSIARKFPDKHCVITTPDCEALYYDRILKIPELSNGFMKKMRYSIMGKKYSQMVHNFPDKNTTYHLVGNDDCEYLKSLKPLDAHFIRHPHYDFVEREISFHRPKIKLLVAGRYDIYMKAECDKAFACFIENPGLKSSYEITFIGKDWDFWYNKFNESGYHTKYINFVPDYSAELMLHDIYLCPITVGTGTKGKVLDAFSNGLMVIGTERALENIAVKDNESCIEYNDTQRLLQILKDIPDNIKYYEDIAVRGRDCVLTKHSPKAISNQFFTLFDKKTC